MTVTAREAKAAPIKDPKIALQLLRPQMGRWLGATLFDGRYDNEPRIVVYYGGREWEPGPTNTYPLDPECAKKIIDEGWVVGTPKIGYTDMHELKLCELGGIQLRRWAKEEETAARALLVPGRHGWSSLYEYCGGHRYSIGESFDWKEGHVFKNPLGEKFVVFLMDKEVRQVGENDRIY